MKASYNFTGRHRLDNDTFNIEIHSAVSGPPSVEVNLYPHSFSEIPRHSVAWLEAYRGPKSMRFRLPSLGEDTVSGRFELSAFSSDEPLLFRLKIVDETEPKHPIRAWRDRIRPVVYSPAGEKKRSILPVYPCDLGSIGWRLNWDDERRPVLEVNSRIGEVCDVASIVQKDPDFALFVFPAVINEVLFRLLSQEADDDDDAEDNEWLIFGARLSGRDFEGCDDDEETNTRLIREWVDAVVQSFGREADLVARYNALKKGGGK
jgi:hypothetical protein